MNDDEGIKYHKLMAMGKGYPSSGKLESTEASIGNKPQKEVNLSDKEVHHPRRNKGVKP